MQSLIPYPISTIYDYLSTSIPCNLSLSFCSIFHRVIKSSFEVLFFFLFLLLLILITQNFKVISLKKLFFISILIGIISSFSYLAYFLWYDSYKDPNLTLMKLGSPIFVNTLNIFTQIFIPPTIISLISYLIFKFFKLQKVFIICLVIFIVITQWLNIPPLWESSNQSIQRGLVLEAEGPKSETKFFSGINHEVINEEIINDPHNSKYKSLRINVKLAVPENKSYLVYTELRDKTNKSVAVQSYVNDKNLTMNAITIDLNQGSNLIRFDFPYAYFNHYVNREVINLPYNDTETGSYGPYRFTFRLSPTNFQEIMNEAALSSSDISKIEYAPDIYTTKNVYKYSDFYQL